MDRDERLRLMNEGQRAFNRGEFYEAHEFWEEVWNEIDDPERQWVQGMIQIATGLHKLTRDRPDVCRTLLVKALAKLEGASELDGYDLPRLREDAAALLAAIDRREKPDPRFTKLYRRNMHT
jgi:predicted metal-dependent hydrolase